MADIGTDHGFLPLYLLEKGISPKVIMTDISPYSLDKARKNFEAFHGDRLFETPKGHAPFHAKIGHKSDRETMYKGHRVIETGCNDDFYMG